MFEYSPTRKEMFSPFIEYRKASDRWNPVNDKLFLYFDRHCLDKYPGIPGITQEMVDSWCVQRKTEQPISCYCRTYIIAELVKFMNRRGNSNLAVPKLVRHDTKRKYIPHAFTQEELSRFFKECDERTVRAEDGILYARALAVSVFFRLIYSTGMRTVEARMMKTENVDLKNGVIDIQKSKGNSQHYVALHESMRGIMCKYDEAVRTVFPARKYFFAYTEENPFYREWSPLVFRSLWDKVNSSRNAVPYNLRHNYAVQNINNWTNQGLDFNDRFLYLSKSMGHMKLESTRYYYSIVPTLANIIEKHTMKDFDDIVPEVRADEEV